MPAIKNIPDDLRGKFLMDGKVKLHHHFIDDSSLKETRSYNVKDIQKYVDASHHRESIGYGPTTRVLYDALDKYPIENQEVAIMGSAEPVYEGICITYGGKPTIIEYADIISYDDRVKVQKYETFLRSDYSFNSAISISTFEHDGLGRYGDPIDPDGDLRAMDEMKRKIKKGGLLFLAVPHGKRDELHWNAHRVYGPHRFPLLIEGWKVLDSWGVGNIFQPVWVLENE